MTKTQRLEAEISRLRKLGQTKRKPDMRHIGGILQEARESKGLGIRDLAETCDLSPAVVTRAEIFGRIELKTLFRLAKGLGVTASGLIAKWETVKHLKK